MELPRVFLMSPASCSGRRAHMLLRDGAVSPLAARLRTGGAPIAEVFTFVSQLYFRGKVAYARAFAGPPRDAPGSLVITSSRGLLDPATVLRIEDLREFATVDIGTDSEPYRTALETTALALRESITEETRVVLLGSIATGKYIDVLHDIFGQRFCYPVAFIGRGDMSRGGLMLRSAEDRRELEYVPIDGRPRRGSRPPRLPKKRTVRRA
jgi:hypothetical protein